MASHTILRNTVSKIKNYKIEWVKHSLRLLCHVHVSIVYNMSARANIRIASCFRNFPEILKIILISKLSSTN